MAEMTIQQVEHICARSGENSPACQLAIQTYLLQEGRNVGGFGVGFSQQALRESAEEARTEAERERQGRISYAQAWRQPEAVPGAGVSPEGGSATPDLDYQIKQAEKQVEQGGPMMSWWQGKLKELRGQQAQAEQRYIEKKAMGITPEEVARIQKETQRLDAEARDKEERERAFKREEATTKYEREEAGAEADVRRGITSIAGKQPYLESLAKLQYGKKDEGAEETRRVAVKEQFLKAMEVKFQHQRGERSIDMAHSEALIELEMSARLSPEEKEELKRSLEILRDRYKDLARMNAALEKKGKNAEMESWRAKGTNPWIK